MNCALCGLTASTGIGEESLFFCCKGCRTVWHLLTAKGEQVNFREHPVFRQAVRSGLISNPQLRFEERQAEEQKRVVLEIGEMWCPSCAEVIRSC